MKQLLPLAIRYTLYAILFFTLYAFFLRNQAYASCWVGDSPNSTTYTLTPQNIQDLGAGGCPNAFNGSGLGPGTWTISCDGYESLCNTYAVRSAVCGNNPEILPGCVACGDMLYCYGNDYRRCDPNSGIFPSPSEFGGNTAGYLSSPSDGIVHFNSVQYSAPPAGIYYCDSNNFACGASACGGETQGFMGGECPASFGFIGGTYFNACTVGPLCDLDEQYYSPGDFIIGDTLTFPVAELPKRAPHPQYDAFNDYICDLGRCMREYSPTDVNNPTDPAMFCQQNAIMACTQFEEPHCDQSDCSTDDWFCASGSFHWCNTASPIGYYECVGSNWEYRGVPGAANCTQNESDFVPIMRCVGDVPDPDNFELGSWVEILPTDTTPEWCENMYAEMPVAFTPGYLFTQIPHLQEIWDDTVNRPNAIFTPFRTARTINTNDEGELEVEFNPVEEWPGESYFNYSFSGGWAMAGDPNEIDPPDRAAVYFRYLGFLLCSRENLIDKLSPFTANPSYQYYEPRCDNFIW